MLSVYTTLNGKAEHPCAIISPLQADIHRNLGITRHIPEESHAKYPPPVTLLAEHGSGKPLSIEMAPLDLV